MRQNIFTTKGTKEKAKMQGNDPEQISFPMRFPWQYQTCDWLAIFVVFVPFVVNSFLSD
jgi:hypothetical protein